MSAVSEAGNHRQQEDRQHSPTACKAGSRIKALDKIILNFTPSWFSVNMGIGILSILIATAPHKFQGITVVAATLYVLNMALFLIFMALSAARYIKYPWVFWTMLQHPTQSLFLGTLPMGLATVVNATVILAVPYISQSWIITAAWALWWIDVVLSLLSCIGIPLLMFHVHELSLMGMTAAWLLPIVPTVVAAASGGLLATVLSTKHAYTTLVVSYVLWGMGMGLSFLVMALYLHRLTLHKLPNSEVIVSAFLPLGPLGQGAFGIIEMSKAGLTTFTSEGFTSAPGAPFIIHVISVLSGLLLWGFGWWWLVHGVYSVTIRVCTGGIHFNMGFWGFVFPLGVFTAATIALSAALGSQFLSYLASVFILVLILLGLGVTYGTLRGAMQGSLFKAPCLATLDFHAIRAGQ